MKVGIGLPNPIPNTSGSTLVEWAQRAEQSGFSALATIDRLVYPGFDSLSSLAAAAAVTSRIELLTNILIAPFYDTVLLAKQAASIHRISQGRSRWEWGWVGERTTSPQQERTSRIEALASMNS